MENEFQLPLNKATITISEKPEIKGGFTDDGREWKMIKLKDTERRTFTFFANKKDGSDTKAFEGFKQLQIRQGSVVDVAFTEEEYTYTHPVTKEAKQGKRRSIKFFNTKE